MSADIISVGGPVLGASGIEGLAEGWSMSFGADVAITAYLSNGSGGPPAIDNMAYITSGPLPDLDDVVASEEFTLPGLYTGEFTLFSNLNLMAGDYWLILNSPGPPDSYANWTVSDQAIVDAEPGAQFLGFSEGINGVQGFAPPVNDGYAYSFAVAAQTPEPSSLYLIAFIATSAIIVRRIGACRSRH
jgi:hypothetical protein